MLELPAKLRGRVNLTSTLFLLAILLRAIIAPFFEDIFNVRNWIAFTALILQGVNAYSFVGSHNLFNIWPYPPFLLGVTAYPTVLFSTNEMLSLLFMKIPMIITDALTAYLLYVMTGFSKGTKKFGENSMLLYLYNPLVFMVTSMWGEFDSIPIFFTVLAYYFFTSKRNKSSALSLGLGIGFKLYPVFLIPAFLARMLSTRNFRDSFYYCVIAALPLSIASIPFLLLDPAAYIRVTFNTGGGIGAFNGWDVCVGIGGCVAPLQRLIPLIIVLFGLFLFMITYRTSLLANCTVSILSLYLLSPSIHQNHYTWIVPYVILGLSENRQSLIRFLYLPAFIDAIVYVGTNNASGPFYWAAFWTGKWINLVPYIPQPSPLTLHWVLLVCALSIAGYHILKFVNRAMNAHRDASETATRGEPLLVSALEPPNSPG